MQLGQENGKNNQDIFVGINLMQIATLNINEIKKFASEFKQF